MVSPVVATSLLMGLLGFQIVIALSMFPTWEAPEPGERCFIQHDGTATPEETEGCQHRAGSPEGDPERTNPPGCAYMKNGECVQRDCREIVPDVFRCTEF